LTEQPGQWETPPEQVPTFPQYPSAPQGGLPYATPIGYPAGPGGGYPVLEGRPGRNGLGIAALVLGILSIPGALIPGLDLLIALVGIVLGIIGWTRAGRRGQTKGLAVAGTILSVIGLICSILFTTATLHAARTCKDIPTGTTAYTQCVKHNIKL
jgi:hypothetical protein